MRPPKSKDGREMPPPPPGGRAAGRKQLANLERGLPGPTPVDQEFDLSPDGTADDESLELSAGAEDVGAADEASETPATAPRANKRSASSSAKKSRRKPSSS